MAAPDSLSDTPLGRSSSMDAREGLSRSDSQQKSKSRRGPRSGNDLFVCFAPRTSLNLVSRPVLSPARDKGREPGRRVRALSSSIFSKAAKKQGLEGGEPTSPKVTCIGQVRVRHKKGKAQEISDGVPKGKQLRNKIINTESGSPLKPDLASGSKKEQRSSACPNFGKDFSCFGLPCDTYGSLPSFRGDKKSCGAVFAKSLVLIQETDGKGEPKESTEKQIELQASSCSSKHVQGQRSISHPKEREDSAAGLQAVQENQAAASQLAPEAVAAEATSSQAGEERALKEQDEPTSHTTEEEDDTFEPEPPPPNALLLMRHKVEHLRVVVPPPSVNITLKRSTSAPVQCRLRSSSNADDEEKSETDLESGKENGYLENDLQKRSKESMSAEALPKTASPSTTQKSVLKRCKSVSQSLTRSGTGVPAQASAQNTSALPGKEKSEAVPQAVLKQTDETSQEAKRMEELKLEHEQALTDFVNAASSRRRSDSEALKISLDVVPETWLWQTCTIVRPPKDSLSHEREKRLDRHKTEWLDAELESSLWKSCKVGEHLKGPEATFQETNKEWLDAEVEAALWRSCGGASTSQHSEDDLKTMCKSKEAGTDAGESNYTRSASLRRNSSVSSHRGCPEVEERESGAGEEDKEAEGRSCDSLHALETDDSNLEDNASVMQGAVETSGICSVSHEDEPVETASGKERNPAAAMVKIEDQSLSMEGVEKTQDETEALKQEKALQQELEQKLSREAQGASTPSPPPLASTPAQAPAPAPDTLLFVSYNMGAFRISLDSSDGIFTESEEPLQSGDQQQKAMLKAMSHLHEVGTYARLLKAASGKERASLSSAFRLQRCKSEPVRLTT